MQLLHEVKKGVEACGGRLLSASLGIRPILFSGLEPRAVGYLSWCRRENSSQYGSVLSCSILSMLPTPGLVLCIGKIRHKFTGFRNKP
jgi:hypothetical protein